MGVPLECGLGGEGWACKAHVMSDSTRGLGNAMLCLERSLQVSTCKLVLEGRKTSTSVGDGLFMAECCRTNTRRSRLVRVPGGLRCRGVGGNGGGGLFEDILTAQTRLSCTCLC